MCFRHFVKSRSRGLSELIAQHLGRELLKEQQRLGDLGIDRWDCTNKNGNFTTATTTTTTTGILYLDDLSFIVADLG